MANVFVKANFKIMFEILMICIIICNFKEVSILRWFTVQEYIECSSFIKNYMYIDKAAVLRVYWPLVSDSS